MHLTIDGIGDSRLLNDSDRVRDFLRLLPERIDMTVIATPAVFARPDGGRIGIVIIAESHISIHTEIDGRFYADVFSCKDFSTEEVKTVIIRAFNAEIHATHLLARGNLPALAGAR